MRSLVVPHCHRIGILSIIFFAAIIFFPGQSSYAQNFAEILKDDKAAAGQQNSAESSSASHTAPQAASTHPVPVQNVDSSKNIANPPGPTTPVTTEPTSPASSATTVAPAPVATQQITVSDKNGKDEVISIPADLKTMPLVRAVEDDSTYTLGVNDFIEITVARHPEVSKQYGINSEGKIQYEFVGDITLAGLTKKQAKDVIYSRLSTYIISPEVTIKILGYNSKVVFVIGEVATPGKIFMRGDTITVREALLQAGLPLLSASTRKCRLITPTADGKAATKYVDVFKLIYEGDLREDLVMKPGDMLYVPATALSKAMRVISPVTQPVTTATGAAREVTRPIRPGF